MDTIFAFIGTAVYFFVMAFAYWEANTYLTTEQQVGSVFEKRCNMYLIAGIVTVVVGVIYFIL